MLDNKKSFIVYCDYAEHLDLLTDEECGQLFKALCAYAGEGKQPENFNSCQKMAFSFIKKQIDRDTEKYNKVIEKRREAGKKGGRPPKTSKANAFSEKQTKAKKADTVNDNDTDTVNVNDTVTVNDTVIKKEGEGERRKASVEYTNDFNVFWEAYPKKVSKATAFKAFKKINPDKELLSTMVKAINAAKQTEQWKKSGGQFIPYPATWLNGSRWEDENEEVTEIGADKRTHRNINSGAFRGEIRNGTPQGFKGE